MFDPNWTALSLEQLDLLDRWLTQQAGGLILVAGPGLPSAVESLAYRPASFARLRVSFRSIFPHEGRCFTTGRQGGELPWPLKFTPEASRAEFLWVADDPEASFQVWQDFEGRL